MSKITGGIGDNLDIELLGKVISILALQLDLDDAVINVNTNLKNDLDLDFIELSDLSQCLSEEFKVAMDATILSTLATIGDVVEYISNNKL